jgi:hypothetical protein
MVLKSMKWFLLVMIKSYSRYFFAALQNKVDLVIVTGGLGPRRWCHQKNILWLFWRWVGCESQSLAHVTQLMRGFINDL